MQEGNALAADEAALIAALETMVGSAAKSWIASTKCVAPCPGGDTCTKRAGAIRIGPPVTEHE